MARGGGTGSRNKKKKATESPVTNNTVDKENLKTTSTNGGSQIDHSSGDQINNKQKNTKNRKQKEETPPHQPTIKEDEEGKDDKQSKLVPTSEQLRLAQITQSQDATMDPMRKAKISQVMDITGKTEDEVATALFDCSWDETKAIELLLEEGGGLGSWEETGKKKKKKIQDEKENGKDNEDWNDDFDPNNQFDNRERSRNRGPPRLRNRGGSQGQMGGQRGESDQWKNREFQENERNYDSGAGRGRGGRGMGPRSRGGANGAQRGHQRGRGAGGPRGYNSRGNEFGERTDQRPPMDTGGFGQIDTWNPMGNTSEGDQNRQQQAPGQQLQQRHPKMNSSKDAFDNAGNWGDDFPAAEDWDNDEYTGSLTESKVFTPSGSSQAKSAVGEPVNGPVPPHPTAVGSSPGGPAPVGTVGDTPPTAANNSLSGSSYSQPIDISALLQKPGGLAGGPTAAPGGPTASLSQYNQTATQDLKSAIGIGSGVKATSEQLAPGYGSSSLSYSSSSAGNVAPGYTSTTSHPTSSFNSAAPGSAFSPIKPAAVTNGSSSGSKALPRARLPPPSKIPSSAVEMPGDSLSNLDVQFGGLDLQFGGSNNDSNSSTNFDFNAAPGPGGLNATPPSQQAAKDSLEMKYAVHSIPSQAKPDPLSASVPGGSPLDSYKSPGVQAPGSNSVKDVNQSLSSALSAAGIKQSTSSDNVPGFGRPDSNSRPDSKSNASGYGVSGVPGPQRSPGPLMTKADTLSYNGPSYSYPSANQSQVKASNNFAVSGYPGSASGYERQNSSGYSATNGLGGSYGGGSGGGSSGYSSSSTPVGNNSYSGSGGYNSAQSASNPGNQFGSNSGYGAAATTNYSPYTSNNSYNSKSSTPNTSYNPVSTTASSSLSQYSETTNKTTTGPSSGYDTVSVSATGGTYGGSNSSTAGGLGLGQGAQTATSSSKMGVNPTTGKIVPGMPPGVASVLPAQYMIGANTGGFPAYLAAAGLGQAPAMYGYGGHQLEDLAALQRSTLAASLPQLVGGAGGPVGSGVAGGSGGPTSKGPSTAGYYDPSSQFGGGAGAPSTLASRQGADPAPSFGGDTSGKFGGVGGVSDSTSSPVPSTVAASGQPTPFNALASTFAAAAPQQHPTLPPGYAYFYGGVGGMPGALQAAAYGGGVGAGVYPGGHPGIPVNTAAGATNTTQFQKQAYGSSYGTSYDSLSLGQSNSGYGQQQKNNYGQSESQQAKSSSGNAGLFQVTGPQMPSGKLINNLGGREPRYW